MDILDIALMILSLLDDSALEKLYLIGLIPSLRDLSSSQLWWHSRVETLSQIRISLDYDVDWKQVYQILKRELRSGETPQLWNEEDNVITVQILQSMNHDLCSDDALSLAARHGAVKCFRYILANVIVDPRESNLIECLHEACNARNVDREREYVAIVSLLLTLIGTGIASSVWHSLFNNASVYGDNEEICKALLSDKRAVLPGWCGLTWILGRGRRKMVELLLLDGRARVTRSELSSFLARIEEHKRLS